MGFKTSSLLFVGGALLVVGVSASSGGDVSFVEQVISQVRGIYFKENNELNIISVAATVLAGLVVLWMLSGRRKVPGKLAPLVPYTIPVVGHAVSFGTKPVELLTESHKKLGEMIRLKIMGTDMTFLTGAEGQRAFYEAPEEVLCARKAYEFTVPVFGKGVVYDCDPALFNQQRRFAAATLTIKRFQVYVDMIRRETEQYLDEHWGASGERELLDSLNDITVRTSVATLQGPEVAGRFTKEFAELYMDLDRALGSVSFFYPYLPIPLHSKRDRARQTISKLYREIIQHRRENPREEEYKDLLEVLMSAKYQDGTPVSDEEIVGLSTAFLLAGQHTSNVTSTWLGCFALTQPEVLDRILHEQESILPFNEPFDLTYEKLKSMEYLHMCIKETLRLRPPIIVIMRKTEVDWQYKDYVVPKGELVCVSPCVANRDPEVYSNPDDFDPERFSKDRSEDKRVKYSYLAFSAGRHACIGEQFAYLQVATIWATILRRYNVEMITKDIKPDYTTLIIAPVKPINVKYTTRTQ